MLPLNNGKLARITLGKSNSAELENRRKFQARLQNLPRKVKEVLLLRQLRSTRAMAVHIYNNRNGNQRSQAVVEFKCKEDRDKALRNKIKYYDTSLKWETSLDPDNKLKEKPKVRVKKARGNILGNQSHKTIRSIAEKGIREEKKKKKIASNNSISDFPSYDTKTLLLEILERLESLENTGKVSTTPNHS